MRSRHGWMRAGKATEDLAPGAGSEEKLVGGDICEGSRVLWGQGQSCSRAGTSQAREARGTQPCLLPEPGQRMEDRYDWEIPGKEVMGAGGSPGWRTGCCFSILAGGGRT